jgi:hypothetical protein
MGALGIAAVANSGSSTPSATPAPAPAPAPADTTAPTVTVTDNVTGTATGPVTYTITFSEAVTGFSVDKLSLDGGSISGFTASADGKTYTVTAIPDATRNSGTLKLTVGTTQVVDAAGNAAVSPAVAEQAYAFGVVTGSFVAGPAINGNGLTVQVFDLAGTPLGSAKVGPDGSYRVVIGAHTGPIIAKIVDANGGHDFWDEAHNAPKDLNAVFMAVDVVSTVNATLVLNLNAATTAAAVKAGLVAADGSGTVTGANTAAQAATIQAANADVAKVAGLTGSLTQTAAIAIVNANGTPNASANALGQFLAALSGMDKANGDNMAATINQLANGITGTGDTAALTSAAQAAIIVGAASANVSAATIVGLLAPTAAAAATGFDPAQAAALTPAVAALLTPTQLQSIADPSVIPADAFATITPTALASLGIGQLGNLSVPQLQNLSGAHLVALAAASKLSALGDLSAVGNAITSLDIATLGTLDAGQLAALSSTQVGAIAAAGKLSAITDLASLGSDINVLSAAQIAGLNGAQLTALNATQVGALATAGKLADLTPAQIAALGDDIAGIDAAALANFSTAQLEGLTAAQIGLLASATPSALTVLNANQIIALGTDITGLTVNQVKALSPAQLTAITSAQADALAGGGKLSALTDTEIILLNGAAIDAVPTGNITQLSAAQVTALSDTQLLGLTKAQVGALATAGDLSALTGPKIAALGNDINGLTAAQVILLGDAQLLGLTRSQIAALATDGDLSLLTGAKLVAVGADISGINAAQAAALTDPQLADLDAAQIGALAADGDLANLSALQIAALGTDITGLTAAQVSALAAPQLGGLTDVQAAALAAAGDLDSLTAANIGALSADAIDRVPTTVITNLGAQGVAALTLAQVQALTGDQLAALNTAGLLDDLTQPLSSAQVTSAAPAGLGFTGIDSADKLALFNDAVQTASGTTALDLAAIASGVAAVQAAVSGGTLTLANLQALGLSGVTDANLPAIKRLIDATSAGTDGSLVNSINELKAIVANASGELADGNINSADAADGVSIAVALPTGATVGQTVALTLPGGPGKPDQTIHHTLTQANLDAGFALVAVSLAQLTAAGEGDKAFTASINGGAAFAVTTVVLDTVAPSATTLNPTDGSTVQTDADLSLVFDAPVAKGTGNIRLVNDTDGTTTTIAVGSNQISISGSTLTINPTADLLPGKAYHIELDAGAIVDLAGNPHAGIANATAWNFTATTLSSTLALIAGDNKVSQAEGASPIAITGTVSALVSASAAIAALQAGDITLSLVPQGGGQTVNLTATSYNTTTGAWAASVGANTLVDGKTYDVTVSITGTTGAAAGLQASTKASVVVDLTPPTAPTITSVTDDVATAAVSAGAVAPGGDTNDTSPLVRVTITGTGALAGDTVQLYNGTNANDPTLGAAVTLSSTHLTQGYVDIALTGLTNATTYTLAARVTDACGNLGAASAGHSIHVDTTVPTLTVSTVALSDDTKGTGVASAHGTDADFNTNTANQTITATLSGSGLASGDRLWGSLNGGTSWTDITSMVSGTAITWTGVTLAGSSSVVFRVSDRAGNIGDNTGSTAYVLDTAGPTFSSAAAVNFAENGTGTAYDAETSEGDTGMFYTLSGNDVDRFNINSGTGAVTFKNAPNFESPTDVGANNVYNFTVRATDLAGNGTDQAVALTVTNVNVTSVQAFGLWQSDGHGTGTPNGTTGALQALSTEIVQQRFATSADGTASGTNVLTQYINRVTGTDVVSDAEFDAGFTITGKAATGKTLYGTGADGLRFFLDNDRTNGQNEVGTELAGNTPGVTINYNSTTGNYSIDFAAGSAALLQATHNTYGSGVHQLTVSSNGDDVQDSGEASRLFLVAAGTANANGDSFDKTGNAVTANSVNANFSVQDKITGNVFVYYHGDPDANGIGLWTLLDAGDAQTNGRAVGNNRDNDIAGMGDFDYYNTTGVAPGTQSTTANTALGFVTNIAAQVWEFQMAKPSTTTRNWDASNTFVGDHSARGSNTSRMASLEEMLALYAANFGNAAAGGNTVGGMQAMTDTIAYPASLSLPIANANVPSTWPEGTWDAFWTAAPTPSGYAYINLNRAFVAEEPSAISIYVSAVL